MEKRSRHSQTSWTLGSLRRPSHDPAARKTSSRERGVHDKYRLVGPATAAERVMGELQNANLDVVDNHPKGVAVDLTSQIVPTKENIDEDTVMGRTTRRDGSFC